MHLTDQHTSEALERQRGRLFAIVYAMLGTTAEAEDLVQEAFARWHEADRSGVRSPAAFLTTVVTRLAIDRLRAAERRRVEYVGPWLPEPLVAELDPADVVSEAEQLSLALLATLERLNPVERAVFLLRDVFDLDYAEIAETVGKEEANCRQIGRRARARVGEPVRRYRATREEEDELLRAFAAAAEGGDVTITAMNPKRIGPVDHSRNGSFLFNYFVADDTEHMLAVFDYTAGWREQETGLDNSTVLLPREGERTDYAIINHCRWDHLWNFMPAILFKRSFRNYVLANFYANDITPRAHIYRLA